jgi:hypothetical protein
MTRVTDTLHVDQYTFLITCRTILLRIRNISDKNFIEIQNTFYIKSQFFENRTIYEIMKKNIVSRVGHR